MLSKTPNSSMDQVLKILDLDKTCFEILSFMALGGDEEFSHNQLRKALNKFGFSIREPTFTRHLKHLEEKNIITRTKTDYKTIIKLNKKSLTSLFNQKDFTKVINDCMDKIEKAKKLTSKELYEELKRYAIDQAYKSLYIKISNLLTSSHEAEKKLYYKWLNILYDNIIDAFIEELNRRGINEIVKVLHMHLEQ